VYLPSHIAGTASAELATLRWGSNDDDSRQQHDLWRSGVIARTNGRRTGRRLACGLVAAALVAAGCASDGESTESTSGTDPAGTEAPADSEPADTADEPADTEAPDAEPTETEATDTSAVDDTTEAADAPTDVEGDFTSRVPALGPPTGEPLRIGLINTEGVPGLDFPDIRINTEATFAYLNEHGGYGGRPLELVSCVSKGSPETSQSCAQEIAGSDVELVLLGLDLFPSYPTFEASDLPVIGLLPLLPGDYTADALFVTGGNATLAAGMAAVAAEQFDAQSVGIISADAPGSNGTEASLTASLDVAGIEYTSIKGGTEETDAGFQGLMSQANADNPDLLVSLYDGPGCIGTMRGRTSLGITTPVLAPNSCAATEVIDQVGDEALGWIFLGAQTNEPSAANDLIAEIMSPVLDVPADEIDPSALGLGGLGIVQAMTLAQFSDAIVSEGGAITGESLYAYMGSTNESIWPSGLPFECGRATAYPSICTFEFPVIEYTEDGTLQEVEGLATVSGFDYLP
jgi:branched-chain amino acid transport system substrate-binding protein